MSAIVMIDKEQEFRDWRRNNPDGYILNTTRRGSRNYLILHKATCRSITGEPSRGIYWTKDYMKVCGTKRRHIDSWVNQQFPGSTAGLCALCFGLQEGQARRN